AEKMAALQAAGITVCESPAVIGKTVAEVLGKA
ncbi:MAG: succinate--CoA ligase subunit alpha, partial [Methanobacteriota archaeon]